MGPGQNAASSPAAARRGGWPSRPMPQALPTTSATDRRRAAAVPIPRATRPGASPPELRAAARVRRPPPTGRDERCMARGDSDHVPRGPLPGGVNCAEMRFGQFHGGGNAIGGRGDQFQQRRDARSAKPQAADRAERCRQARSRRRGDFRRAPASSARRSADTDCCRNAITRRIQSTNAMPRCPSGAGRSLKSRCTWALTSPGRIADVSQIADFFAMLTSRLHHKRRFAPPRCSPRRRQSARRRRETRTGHAGLFAYQKPLAVSQFRPHRSGRGRRRLSRENIRHKR